MSNKRKVSKREPDGETLKSIAKKKLIDYLSNPNNKSLTRAQLSTKVLGWKNAASIHNMFSAEELHGIEFEALEAKRKRYSSELSKVDKGVLKRAVAGDVNAAKLAYQRFENWAPAKELKVKSAMKVTIDKDDAGCL